MPHTVEQTAILSSLAPHPRRPRLVHLREELGLTKRGFALRVGISPTAYKAIEAGRGDVFSVASGDWRPIARAIAAFQRLDPEALWPGVARTVVTRVERDRAVDRRQRSVIADTSIGPIDIALDATDVADPIDRAVRRLTCAARSALTESFGVDGGEGARRGWVGRRAERRVRDLHRPIHARDVAPFADAFACSHPRFAA